MIKTVESKCPYCDIKNITRVEFDRFETKKEVVTCELVEGGCGLDYVVEAKIKVECISKGIVVKGDQND